MATVMSRPAAAFAQQKWASVECISHDDRGEMILDLYLQQRHFCVVVQPATFSSTFGHYDPALACRVAGCLLEHYDDVELDHLSVLQFYDTSDERSYDFVHHNFVHRSYRKMGFFMCGRGLAFSGLEPGLAK